MRLKIFDCPHMQCSQSFRHAHLTLTSLSFQGAEEKLRINCLERVSSYWKRPLEEGMVLACLLCQTAIKRFMT